MLFRKILLTSTIEFNCHQEKGTNLLSLSLAASSTEDVGSLRGSASTSTGLSKSLTTSSLAEKTTSGNASENHLVTNGVVDHHHHPPTDDIRPPTRVAAASGNRSVPVTGTNNNNSSTTTTVPTESVMNTSGAQQIMNGAESSSSNSRPPSEAVAQQQQRARRPTRPPTAEEASSNRRRSSRGQARPPGPPVGGPGGGGSRVVRPTMDLPPGFEMRITAQGQVYFHHIPTGVLSWHDPRIPRDFDTQNLSVNTPLGPLPHGWEQRKTASGRIYFVDHNNRTTQFTDPRLNGQILNLIRRQNVVPGGERTPATGAAHAVATTNGGSGSAVIMTTTGGIGQHEMNQRNVHESGNSSGQVNNNNGHGSGPGAAHPNGPPPHPQLHHPAISNGHNMPADLPQALLESAELLPKYRRDLVGKLKAFRTELQAFQPQSGHCRLEVVSRQEVSSRFLLKIKLLIVEFYKHFP